MGRTSARLASKQLTKRDSDSGTPQKETPKKRGYVKVAKKEESFEARLSESSIDDDLDDSEDIDEEDEGEIIIAASPVKRVPQSPREVVRAKSPVADELGCARNKLNDALAHVSKGDGMNEDDCFTDDDHMTFLSPSKLKRTRGPRKSKKRLGEDGYTKTSSFVLKLFDRSVDLAEFSCSSSKVDSSLYPICRAWIRNKSSGSCLLTSEADNAEHAHIDHGGDDGLDRPQGIYILPPPVKAPKDSKGKAICIRIPETVKKPVNVSKTIDSAMTSELDTELLSDNLIHWKKVRQDWQRAARTNEARYRHSCTVLKAMYERSQAIQPVEFEQLSKPAASPPTVY